MHRRILRLELFNRLLLESRGDNRLLLHPVPIDIGDAIRGRPGIGRGTPRLSAEGAMVVNEVGILVGGALRIVDHSVDSPANGRPLRRRPRQGPLRGRLFGPNQCHRAEPATRVRRHQIRQLQRGYQLLTLTDRKKTSMGGVDRAVPLSHQPARRRVDSRCLLAQANAGGASEPHHVEHSAEGVHPHHLSL